MNDLQHKFSMPGLQSPN